jgi:hypothetical protein
MPGKMQLILPMLTTGIVRDFLIAANPKDSASLGKTIAWWIRKFEVRESYFD